MEKTIEYYKGQIDYLYIFSNKAITSSSDSFKRIVSILNNAGINVQLITDTTILDIVRKYPNLALYYFEHHSFNQKWFDNHAQEIYAKLGDKYNDNFNADTQTALAISMFVHDRDAVEYLNNKKESLLKSIRDLDWRYDAFDEFKTALEVAVLSIPNVTVENIVTCLSWNGIIQDAVGQKLDAFKLEIKNLEIEKIRLDTDAQKTDDDKRLQQIYDFRERIELFEKLISIADSLKLTENESKLIQSNILVLEGKAGVGKSHLLANETKKLLSYGRWVLLLLGGDYSGRNSILEQICSELGVKYSFDEVLELLNTEGEKLNYIVPIFIDAINETWNNTLWKSALPRIFNRIRQLKYVRLVISFRTEYKKVLIDEIELKNLECFVLNTMDSKKKVLWQSNNF